MSYLTFKINELKSNYDYIVIGGGTAGCVLANRLSTEQNKSVLLIERGKPNFTWTSRVPLFSCNFPADTVRNRKFFSEPQKNVGNRELELVVGYALGGSSRINALLYTRGLAAEFNAWGRKGWSYEEIHHYFLKSEHSSDPKTDSNDHGKNGCVIDFSVWKTRTPTKLVFDTSNRAVKAAENLGFSYIPDVNSSDTPVLGMANMSYTMDERGYRNDTASAFLPPSLVKNRKNNLNISTGVLVTKILFSSDNPSSRPRAVGVQVESADGPSNKRGIMVNKEIILCAGAIGSPQLLLLSGIGPKDHLSEMNIEVVKDLPGVGNHMQDHFGIPVIFQIPLNDSIIVLQKRPLTAIKEILKFLISGQGLLTSPIHELSVFAQSRSLTADFANAKSGDRLDWTDPSNIPDLEIMTIAIGETDLSKMSKDTDDGGFGLWTGVVQPLSRGCLRLKSTDPRATPSCDLNFLGDPRDREAAYAGISLSMRLKEEIAKQGYHIIDVAVPKSLDPADLDAHIIAQGLTLYHYSSSCRMAPEDDPLPGVVDDELKVHGIDGLRIADASIFPNVLATHLQAAVAVVAEKCADMVLNEASH